MVRLFQNLLLRLQFLWLDIQNAFEDEAKRANRSRHAHLEHILLTVRNGFVLIAAFLFTIHLFIHYSLLNGIAYFFGAGAYLLEIVLMTHCFQEKIPHKEAFMAYCFGPLYVLMGINYLMH